MNHVTTESAAEGADLDELPEGVSHLLAADDELAEGGRTGTHVAVCGAPVRVAHLPSLTCNPEYEWNSPLYCPACVRAAGRWSAPLPLRPAGAAATRCD